MFGHARSREIMRFSVFRFQVYMGSIILNITEALGFRWTNLEVLKLNIEREFVDFMLVAEDEVDESDR